MRNFQIVFAVVVATMATRCQFHQHFTHDIFVQKCFCSFSLVKVWLFNFFGAIILAKKLLVKCWWHWLQPCCATVWASACQHDPDEEHGHNQCWWSWSYPRRVSVNWQCSGKFLLELNKACWWQVSIRSSSMIIIMRYFVIVEIVTLYV